MSIKPTILAMMALIGLFFSASAQTKLSVQAGFNFTNVSYTLGDKKQDPEPSPFQNRTSGRYSHAGGFFTCKQDLPMWPRV